MQTEFETWKADRLAALSAEDGWLNLVARIDVRAGSQSVGSGPECDAQLPSGPALLGELTCTNGQAAFSSPGGQSEPFAMGPGGFPLLKVPPFLLELHDPGDAPALRVRDLTLPREIALDYFPHDPDWVIRAEWVELAGSQDIDIGQKGGADTRVTLTHEARFQHDGRQFVLVPTHWKAGNPMFVLRDATSGRETYAASRFLIAEDFGDGQITLDFNRVHNPPCAFSDFAVCPLPPPSNVLPFPIRAGEKLP